ncbi:MAG TPA: hypothetical protein VGM11_12185 [Acidobacteriaceae bacterium]|jgi:hypothetical protein
MDVHAPHEPVHTWKDFAIHLTIVTIGLFIALMLEAGVQYWHHRHIVAEARANIRTELENNRTSAQHDVTYLGNALKQVDNNVKEIHVLQQHENVRVSITNTLEFEPFSDAAWRTARDTGALAYMPYGEVQRYSQVYMLVGILNDRAIAAEQADFRSLAPAFMGYDMGKLPPEEYMEMLRGNAVAKIDLEALQQYARQFGEQCAQELSRH